MVAVTELDAILLIEPESTNEGKTASNLSLDYSFGKELCPDHKPLGSHS